MENARAAVANGSVDQEQMRTMGNGVVDVAVQQLHKSWGKRMEMMEVKIISIPI